MKKQYDFIYDNFLNVNLNKVVNVPVIVVTYNPVDYPNKYVARLWNLKIPTINVLVKDTLEEIHQAIPLTFAKFIPTEDDDPVIVETFI